MYDVMVKHDIDPDAALIPPRVVTYKAPVDDPDFRAKIAIESLKGEASITKISRDFLVEKSFIKECRDRLLASAPKLFREGQDGA